MGFIYLEKAYARVNREALWQVFRMYDGRGVNLSVELRVCMLIVQHMSVNGGESERFRIDSGVR